MPKKGNGQNQKDKAPKKNNRENPAAEEKNENENAPDASAEGSGDGAPAKGEAAAENPTDKVSNNSDGGESESKDAQKSDEAVRAIKQTAKKAGSAALSVLKAIFQIVSKSFKIHWLLGLIVLLIVIVLVLMKAYLPDWSIYEESDSQSIDTQVAANIHGGAENQQKFQEYLNEMNAILEKEGVLEDYQSYYNELSALNANNAVGNFVTSTSENIDTYNNISGYQVLRQEAILLTYLTRLSYAFSALEWTPNPSDSEEDVAFTEYNRITKAIKESIDNKISNNNMSTYTFPSGESFFDLYKGNQNYISSNGKIYLNYYKDNKNVDTTEPKDSLYYLHNILNRKRTHQFMVTDDSLDCPNLADWLDKRELKDADKKDDNVEVESLQNIESPYKMDFETLHHEITLKLAQNENITNRIFLEDNKAIFNDTVSKLIPMFDYATYNEQIKEKTFFNYELYNNSAFDDKGQYKVENSLWDNIYELATNPEYNIDYSNIEYIRVRETQLWNLVNGIKTGLKSGQFMRGSNEYESYIKKINTTLEEIGYTDEELEEFKSYAEAETQGESEYYIKTPRLEEEYKKRAKNLDTVILAMDDVTIEVENENGGNEELKSKRAYDAHNHNVFQYTNYYFDRYKFLNNENQVIDEYVSDYKETITINAREQINGSLSGQDLELNDGVSQRSVEYSGTPTGNSFYVIESAINVTTEQKSLLPVRFQSLFINMNYNYTKERAGSLNAENIAGTVSIDAIKRQIEKSIKDAKWYVEYLIIDEEEQVARYYRETTVTVSNSGKLKIEAEPGRTEDNGSIDDDLKEYYGLDDTQVTTTNGTANFTLGEGTGVIVEEETTEDTQPGN